MDELKAPELVGGAALKIVVGFCERLRSLGIFVSTAGALDYVNALRVLGVEQSSSVYWAGRATLVHEPEDIEVYDKAFSEFWPFYLYDSGDDFEFESVELEDNNLADEPSGEDEAEPGGSDHALYSDIELLRHKDFSHCTEAELKAAYAMLQRLRLVGPPKRTRRLERSVHKRGVIDIRRTVRRAVRQDGEIIDYAFRRPGQKHRKVMLFCDVSGSMDRYMRALLRFAHAAVVKGRDVEVFSLGTRLTRLTRELETHDLEHALVGIGDMVEDLSGGTRLGEGFKQFNDDYAIRGLARGAVVVVLSDGIDQGAPEILARQMARLRLVAHRIIWVNPLKSSPGYQPISRGMAACLPYIDAFMEGHSVAALEELVAEVKRVAPGRGHRPPKPAPRTSSAV